MFLIYSFSVSEPSELIPEFTGSRRPRASGIFRQVESEWFRADEGIGRGIMAISVRGSLLHNLPLFGWENHTYTGIFGSTDAFSLSPLPSLIQVGGGVCLR